MSETRRSFFVTAASAAASTVVGSVARGYAANEQIRVGVVGTGGRARHLMKALKPLEGIRITRLCDVWDKALDEAAPLADAQAARTKVAAELFADDKLDAVLIGTPDHHHAAMTLAAVAGKKDVYVEKPLTHSKAEGDALIAAGKSTKQIVQVGMQQRSMPHVILARELVQAGAIGPVVKVAMSWNRNSDRVRRFPLGVDPKSVDWPAFRGKGDAAFDEYRFRNWRWFWDFGGGIFTDLMVHWVDVAHFVLGLAAPDSAASSGQFTTAKGVWETPDTVQTVLSYATPTKTPVQMHFEGTFANARHGARIEFLGSEATLYLDRGRLELIPEKGKKVAARQEILGTGPPGLDFYDKPDGEKLHLQNWLDCVRSRKEPAAPLAAGVHAADAAHLANAALRGRG